MNIEDFRTFCLSLPGTTEKMPFQRFGGGANILVFYIDGKTYCYVDIEKFDRILIKGEPERIARLKEEYLCVHEPVHFKGKQWVTISLNEDMSETVWKELIVASYEIVHKAAQAKKLQRRRNLPSEEPKA